MRAAEEEDEDDDDTGFDVHDGPAFKPFPGYPPPAPDPAPAPERDDGDDERSHDR
jgi:hypothetical protein